MRKIILSAFSLLLAFVISAGSVFATEIAPIPEQSLPLSLAEASLSKTEYTYNGKERKPKATAIDSLGNEVPRENIEIIYRSNKSIGIGKAIIKLSGGYEGTEVLTFRILPKKAKKPQLKQLQQKQLSITVEEDTSVSGYQIRYATNKSFKKAKTYNLTRSRGLTASLYNLKGNAKYYVKVRGYKLLGSGEKLYGAWSKAASKKLTTSAAHPDLPTEMLESYVVDSMKYLGYKVEKQKRAGSFLQDYACGPRTPSTYLTGITYNGVPSGQERIKDKSTVSGYAPNLKYFKQYGLVCASYVSYYYLNYLPNIAGVDTSYIKAAIKKFGNRSQSCDTWGQAAKYLVKKGKAKVVDKSSYSLPGATLSKLKIGDLICFSVPNMGLSCGHVAVYAGTNNEGDHFVAHVGDDAGPVFQTLERFQNIVHQHDGCAYSVVYRFKDLPNNKYDYKVSLKRSTYKFSGEAVTPKVDVRDAAGNTIDKKYYTIHYKNNKKVGKGKVTVVFKGKYRGAENLTFKIK